MPEDNKKYNTDDVVWYYPFPGERVPLRNTRYKAVVLDAIEVASLGSSIGLSLSNTG